MKNLFLMILILFSKILFANEKEYIITEVPSDHLIKAERLDKVVNLNVGDLMVIYSHESMNVLGYAEVLSIGPDGENIEAKVESHDKNGLIRIQNFMQKIDLSKIDNNIPGRYDLVSNSDGKVAAKYRPLVYAGLASGMTAANLVRNEFLIGPSIIAYGLNNYFQINSNLISDMFKVINLGIKTKIFEFNDITFSIENVVQYYHLTNRGSYQFIGYLDSTSNSNFKTYGKVKMFTKKPQDLYLYNSDEYKKDLNIELQLSYGFITNSWGQLIFGPKVDVDKKRVGGQIGYYIADKNVNTMIGISSNDFSEFKLGKEGYLINLDLWWRF
jgi:hypothetical protein